MAGWPNSINDEVLLLRTWQAGDETRLAQLLDHPMVYDLNPYGPKKLPADLLEKTILEQIQDRNFIRFVIIPRALNQIVGSVGGQILPDNRFEIGFWTGFKYWNQGYTKRAVRRLVEAATKSTEFNRLEAKCYERNAASAHILLKAGFQIEGRLPNFALYDRPPETILTFEINCVSLRPKIEASEQEFEPKFSVG